MNNVEATLRQEWEKQDRQELARLKLELKEFNKLYLKHFEKPLYRKANILVIQVLTDGIKELHARLYGNKTSRRSVRYRMAGHKQKTGQA